MSDLDIAVVIAEPYSETLCARQEQVSPETAPERLALFSKFGTPALIHENNNNAPAGGTFTFVLYSASALMVDWTLLSQQKAERPLQSLLLFEKVNIPVAPPPEPEPLEASRKLVAEQWAFFWMMAAVTVKYFVRGDGVFVTRWLEILHGVVEEIERHLLGKPREYIRGALSQFQPAREMQIEAIRSLCRTMQALAPQIERFSGTMLVPPSAEIERLLALVDDDYARD